MCRDGYDVECSEDGCTNRVTCRSENDLCKEHGFDQYIEEDESAEEFDAALDAAEPVEIQVTRDWIDDPDLTREEKLARFESLRPEPTRTHPRFYTSGGMLTVGGGATVTYNWLGQ